MIVATDPQRIDASCRGGVVSVGNFDGVHLGHAALLDKARQRAAGQAVIAVTFEPHPVALLAPHRAPRRLTPLPEKLRALEALGITAAMVLPTDRALLSMEARDFIERMLVGPLAPAWLVEGPDFGFGAGRRGNVQTLRELGRALGFEVDVIEPRQMVLAGRPEAVNVSSSLIRDLLAAGDVEAAAACMGRAYVLVGKVMRGAGMGRQLGYPTMNLDCDGQQLPADGVYAGRAGFDSEDAETLAAISIGSRATFDGAHRVVEAHLLDATGDYYDRTVRLEVCCRLREQQRFGSREDLMRQIETDVRAVREWSQT